MKATEKIIIAGIVGTTFMTLYSYMKAKKENQEYVEPIMINKLINNSKNLPSIQDEDIHPAGWGLHYAAGVSFIGIYWLLWKKVLTKPTVSKILIIGAISGLTGILVWKMLFRQQDSPPYNYRYGYYKQLFTAHIVFSLFALVTYNALDKGLKSQL